MVYNNQEVMSKICSNWSLKLKRAGIQQVPHYGDVDTYLDTLTWQTRGTATSEKEFANTIQASIFQTLTKQQYTLLFLLDKRELLNQLHCWLLSTNPLEVTFPRSDVNCIQMVLSPNFPRTLEEERDCYMIINVVDKAYTNLCNNPTLHCILTSMTNFPLPFMGMGMGMGMNMNLNNMNMNNMSNQLFPQQQQQQQLPQLTQQQQMFPNFPQQPNMFQQLQQQFQQQQQQQQASQHQQQQPMMNFNQPNKLPPPPTHLSFSAPMVPNTLFASTTQQRQQSQQPQQQQFQPPQLQSQPQQAAQLQPQPMKPFIPSNKTDTIYVGPPDQFTRKNRLSNGSAAEASPVADEKNQRRVSNGGEDENDSQSSPTGPRPRGRPRKHPVKAGSESKAKKSKMADWSKVKPRFAILKDILQKADICKEATQKLVNSMRTESLDGPVTKPSVMELIEMRRNRAAEAIKAAAATRRGRRR